MRIAHRLEIINRSTTAPNAGDWGEYQTGGGGGGDGYLTTIHSNPTTHLHGNRDRLNSRKNSRKPGVDRSPQVYRYRERLVNNLFDLTDQAPQSRAHRDQYTMGSPQSRQQQTIGNSEVPLPQWGKVLRETHTPTSVPSHLAPKCPLIHTTMCGCTFPSTCPQVHPHCPQANHAACMQAIRTALQMHDLCPL